MAPLPPLSPERFVGRTNVVAQIEERLRHPEFLSSSVVGGPQIGKTSLLRYLSRSPSVRAADGARVLQVIYDAEILGSNATPFDFWTGALRELRSHPDAEPLADLVKSTIARAAASELDEYDLQDVFDAAARGGLRIALLIDNFDNALRNNNFWRNNDFFHHVRTLGQRMPRGLAFTVATMRPLLDYWRPGVSASPFYNIFLNFPLEMLSDAELHDHVDRVLHDHAVDDPTGTVIEMVISASRGHPLVAAYVLELSVGPMASGRPLDPDDLADRLSDPAGPLVVLSRRIREALTPSERHLLDRLLNEEPLQPAERDRLRYLGSYGLLPPGVTA
ncbi:MAG: ATP-binding protein [Acetobacteraceae bacterium]